MSDKTIKALILKDFKDAGTEESFTKDAVVPLDEGTFANYEAAGLVSKSTAAATKSDAKSDA